MVCRNTKPKNEQQITYCSNQWCSLFSRVSVSNVSGLVSGSKDFGLELETSLETLHELFFLWSLARSGFLKTDLQSNCLKFSRSNRSVAKLSLLLCYYGENNFPSTLFKICAKFNKNSVCTSETAAHDFCNTCNETLR